MIALFNKPPSSGEPVYHVAEVIVLIAAVLEVLGTLWVSCDAGNRRTAETRILNASFIMFMLGLILGAYALM
jgi:heme/copper-type cytochrome/quinol oxidase subunit 1